MSVTEGVGERGSLCEGEKEHHRKTYRDCVLSRPLFDAKVRHLSNLEEGEEY